LEKLAHVALDGLTAQIAILDGEGKILAVNAAWRASAGSNAPASCAIGPGVNYLRVCDAAAGDWAEEADGAASGIRAVLAGETDMFSLDYPCHSPTAKCWFNLRITRFPGDGLARVIVSHEDITARRGTEEALRHRVEELAAMTLTLERRNAELDQFAYITSHDLRAPLRGIANLSRWIEEDLEEAISPEVALQFDLLRGRVNRMDAMIEGILRYSRVGRAEVAPETVDVKALLTDVIDLLHPPLGIAITLDDDMPTLLTQRLSLQQVFQNLLSNAIKHHDKANGHIHVGVKGYAGWHEFSVADDGPGIAPKYHDNVWMIFQTLEARDKVENTGVGLALVKKIVEDQGGTVGVTSEEGKGATFHFTWPLTLSGPTALASETRKETHHVATDAQHSACGEWSTTVA